MKNNENFINIDDINIQYNNFLSYLNNKNYKMILTIGKNKKGTEQFILYEGHTQNLKTKILPKDLIKEQRTNGTNVIGTSLVNIINCLPNLLKIFEYYKSEIKNIDIKEMEVFYNQIIKQFEQSKIKNIPNIHQCINKILEFSSNQKSDVSDLEIVQKLKILSNDKGVYYLCSYIIKVLKLQKNFPTMEYLSFSTLTDIIIYFYEIVDINTIVSVTADNIINTIFFLMTGNIRKNLQENYFIINTFIDNFRYFFKTIFKMNNFIIFKNDIKAKALYTDTNNIYYKELYKYLENKKDISNIEDKLNICIIFIDSLCKQLTNLKELLEKSNSFIIENQLELPKANITFSNDNSNDRFLKASEYIYEINTIQDFVNISLYYIIADNRKLLKCHNCNKYFISDVRNSEIYCRRIDPNDPHHRKCAEIALAKRAYIYSDDERSKKYKNIYTRLKNCKEKYETEKELEIFVEKYKEYKNQICNIYKKANYDRDFKNQKLLNWLIQYDNKLRKKYPSNRYDLKKKHL